MAHVFPEFRKNSTLPKIPKPKAQFDGLQLDVIVSLLHGSTEGVPGSRKSLQTENNLAN